MPCPMLSIDTSALTLRQRETAAEFVQWFMGPSVSEINIAKHEDTDEMYIHVIDDGCGALAFFDVEGEIVGNWL